MSTPDPLNVAFVWHMHQPSYRLAPGGAFDLPWARMHALKDYLDMVESLAPYPALHATFNLVPSLVEQLEDYARDDFVDVYWELTLKPAEDLTPSERAFIVERMCERPGHPRARAHPRYLELTQKREACAAHGWEACAQAFGVAELRDLQVWFNLAWFEPAVLEKEPLVQLMRRGRDFSEGDKAVMAAVQADILARTLPAYREAARRGQIELSTSPYYHPILPLLANTDAARVAVGAARLPPTRFAHPEDAAEQVRLAIAKHEAVFGDRPRGMWCSEQAVGEDVIPLLTRSGLDWTISDEIVLRRSLAGTVRSPSDGRPQDGGQAPGRPGLAPTLPPVDDPLAAYWPYLLEREGSRVAIVFRDHTLSDLIGFAYQSWDSRHAAADLIQRLHHIRTRLEEAGAFDPTTPAGAAGPPLVTIALDGENAWEYYPRDGRDFLEALYEGLSTDSTLRCVTVSEHLAAHPARRALPWLHTGSWIGGDLGTWIGDDAHGLAWEALHRTRDTVAAHGLPGTSAEAWRHIHTVEGSDWFWWFGDRHRTELDHVWDQNFRLHLREACRLVGETAPVDLFFPILRGAPVPMSTTPTGPLSPVIDGRMSLGRDGEPDEWAPAGLLIPDIPSTMQRAEGTRFREVRYGWCGSDLCLVVVPSAPSALPGLEVELLIVRPGGEDIALRLDLEEQGRIRTACRSGCDAVQAEQVVAAWDQVLELSLPLGAWRLAGSSNALVLHVGRDGMVEHTFQVTVLEIPHGGTWSEGGSHE